MKEKLFYVYAHYILDTDEIFYIGKGCGNRVGHKRGRNKLWKNIVNKHKYKVKILIDNLEESDAFIQEILAIKEFNPRANLTKGGEGSSGHVSPYKGKSRYAGENNPMFGKNIKSFMSSEDYAKWKINVNKANKAKKGIKRSQTFREKLSKANKGENNSMFGETPWNKGKQHSEETKRKISQKATGRVQVRKPILWVEKNIIDSAVNIAKMLKSHPQSVRQAAREQISHKKYRFTYV